MSTEEQIAALAAAIARVSAFAYPDERVQVADFHISEAASYVRVLRRMGCEIAAGTSRSDLEGDIGNELDVSRGWPKDPYSN